VIGATDERDDRVRRWTSVLFLVAVNLLPVAFLAAGTWEPGDVLVAYWLENLVVGAFAVYKIRTARGTTVVGTGLTITSTRTIGGRTTRSTKRPNSAGGPAALAGFFVVHFGMFTLVHGIFTGLLAWSIGVSGSLREWTLMMLALIASHGFSTWLHWVCEGERDQVSPSQAMLAPYARIVVLHLVVIGSFFLVFRGIGDPDGGGNGTHLAPALALIALKTAVDVIAHLREHRALPSHD
jgi:hypothetical protein